MNLTISALPALDSNYIWLLRYGGQLVCVDPGDSQIVLDYLNTNKELTLSEIWLTHGHADHTGGVSRLCALLPGLTVRGFTSITGVNRPLADGDNFLWHNMAVKVWHTLGHKNDHLVYLLDYRPLRVFCGDILFSAGCGRNFEGTLTELFASLCRLGSLPDTALLYPGHEYTCANLQFAATLEPDNKAIKAGLFNCKDKKNTLPVTLAHEKAVNPFLRVNTPIIRDYAQQRQGQTKLSPLAIFSYLRRLKDEF